MSGVVNQSGRRAVVVGAGPNGLVAAITLARAGWDVTVFEAAAQPGGGTRTEEFTLPGVLHDVCSAIHPLAVGSPAFREIAASDTPLEAHGLEWIHPDVPVAHPLDDGRAAVLHRSVSETASGLGADAKAYRRLFGPFVEAGFDLTDGLLSPFTIPPKHPVTLARYGAVGILPAHTIARRGFDTDEAQALFAGLAGHSILSLKAPVTAGYGLMLGVLAHLVGWPLAKGGSQQIANALVAVLEDLGGRVECDRRIMSLQELPAADAVLLDLTPRQLLAVAGDAVPNRYRRALTGYRYGPGVFKLDLALDGPIPWTNTKCARAATVHIGGTLGQITAAEAEVQSGGHPERPYVLLSQPSLFDATRAPPGLHTAWAYCHVPGGSSVDVSSLIERQIERHAPGFGKLVLARATTDAEGLERYNENYVGGDINGGSALLSQLFTRPVARLDPYSTPNPRIFLCSSSTPPGGGVHGMCGYWAAASALRRVFRLAAPSLWAAS